METTEIPWGDGSGDKIYLTRNASEGDQVVMVSSDANQGTSERTKNIVFSTGDISRTLSVKQLGVPPVEYTARLVASEYAVSSTAYLSVSNAERMYNNTDNTTFATINNTNASTSSRYLYLRGFNFGAIPANARIKSFVVKVKGYEYRLATDTSYAPRLTNGTNAISGTGASENFDTSVKTIQIPTGALTWTQIKNYGANFTIRMCVRRASKNQSGSLYVYGAEIEVKYTL